LRRRKDEENQQASLNDPLKVSIVSFTRSKANKIKKTINYFKIFKPSQASRLKQGMIKL
jgi:hypothetical protein